MPPTQKDLLDLSLHTPGPVPLLSFSHKSTWRVPFSLEMLAIDQHASIVPSLHGVPVTRPAAVFLPRPPPSPIPPATTQAPPPSTLGAPPHDQAAPPTDQAAKDVTCGAPPARLNSEVVITVEDLFAGAADLSAVAGDQPRSPTQKDLTSMPTMDDLVIASCKAKSKGDMSRPGRKQDPLCPQKKTRTKASLLVPSWLRPWTSQMKVVKGLQTALMLQETDSQKHPKTHI